MDNKLRPILNLLVTIDGVQYVVGRLRFNAGEFSYFFTYPSDSPEFHLNCTTGEVTSRFDHITWHNGRIHIKRKDNTAIETIHYSGPLLLTTPTITPLYIESFYFNKKPCLIKESEFQAWKGSSSQKILSLDSSSGFSLIFFLTPSKVSNLELLMNFCFMDIPEGLSCAPSLIDLCDLDHRLGRITVWENWDIVVVTTRFVQSTLSPIPLELWPCRLPNYTNIPAALTDLMLQANGLNKLRYTQLKLF